MKNYYRNKKTGDIYYGGETALDVSDETGVRVMVIYHKVGAPHRYYLREITEFNSKFDMVVKG
jgi:hypothetical protein